MGAEKEQAVEYPSASEENIVYYPLPGLFPDGYVLAVNKRLGLLSLLASGGEKDLPRLLVQERFSANEIRVLLPLLDHYPDYCPYEVTWASFYSGQATQEAVDRARLRLQEAQFAGVWDYEMRPVRNILSRVRMKLHYFALDTRSIVETGYLLKTFASDSQHFFHDSSVSKD